MERSPQQDQFYQLMRHLYHEGVLVGQDKFKYLFEKQSQNNPTFVADVVSAYCKATDERIAEISTALENAPINFWEMEMSAFKLGNSSSCIGGDKVETVCEKLRKSCQAKNPEECGRLFEELKRECAFLSRMLADVVMMQNLIQEKGEVIPMNWD